MPGLVGILEAAPGRPVDVQLAERMAAAVVHRPWYRVDSHAGAGVALARVHHGVVSPGPQRSASADETLTIFLDGEIYDERAGVARRWRGSSQHTIATEPNSRPATTPHVTPKLRAPLAERRAGPVTADIVFRLLTLTLWGERFLPGLPMVPPGTARPDLAASLQEIRSCAGSPES